MYDNLLKNASKSVETLNQLKCLAVEIGEYELGAECRKLELELYPKTEEEINAKAKGDELNRLFRMVDLNIDDEICYKIYKTLEVYKKKKGKFDTLDASKIIVECKKLFIR